MSAKDVSRFLLYRWRYIIGYGLIGALLVGLLVFAGLYAPGGISPEEMRSTVQSDAIRFTDPSTYPLINLPFHLLQAGVFNIFGITEFTIKLPSLIFGLFSAVGIIVLLRRWFRPNIAVLASLIAVTTGQFLFIAQNGVPSIMYVFWPVTLLLLGTQITRQKHARFLWKILFTIAAALSLYTPLSIYPIIAIILAIILHPHLRNAFRRLSKIKLLVCALFALATMTPLVLGLIADPILGLTLLGIPTTWPPDIWANLQQLFQQYFVFWEPSTTTLMTPVFGLGSLFVITVGIYRLIRTRETTRSYLLIIWTLCLIPILLLEPNFTSVVFVPSVMLLAAGLTSLIDYWYRLFPFNPYARIAGLIPLIMLISVLLWSGIDRYVYGYHYDPNTVVNFSRDLSLLPKNMSTVVVSEDELPFYQAVARHRDGLDVRTTAGSDEFARSRAATVSTKGYGVDQIVTTTYSVDGDRWYIYKKLAE